MNVNRDTVNDFSLIMENGLIGRFEIFESNIHDTILRVRAFFS